MQSNHWLKNLKTTVCASSVLSVLSCSVSTCWTHWLQALWLQQACPGPSPSPSSRRWTQTEPLCPYVLNIERDTDMYCQRKRCFNRVTSHPQQVIRIPPRCLWGKYVRRKIFATAVSVSSHIRAGLVFRIQHCRLLALVGFSVEEMGFSGLYSKQCLSVRAHMMSFNHSTDQYFSILWIIS